MGAWKDPDTSKGWMNRRADNAKRISNNLQQGIADHTTPYI